MQDIHAISGGAGTITALNGGEGAGAGGGGVTLFVAGSNGGGGGGSGGDRRLRQNNNQILKCPRCDSSNTKFCYYNNYNLSQPRHFCKNCRRYWTKGGVLRNVPVGGGCRKAKRGKTKQSEEETKNTELESNSNSNSNSSSESSSLTATNNTAAKSSHEVASATATVNSTNSVHLPPPSRFFLDQNLHPSIFPEAGSFMSLMTPPPGDSPPPPPSSLLGFNFTAGMPQNNSLVDDHNASEHMMLARGNEDYKMDQINYGYFDPTANIGFTSLQQSRVSIGGLTGVDWQINGEDVGGTGTDQDQGLFDFGEADQAYLSQNHWLDSDTSLNFPPLV